MVDLETRSPIFGLLNFCKGLAIIWIFLIHWRPEWFGWQGVHIFIVLSGFGLTYSCIKRDKNIYWKEWYLKRFRKILPPYWLVCLWGYLILVCVYLFESNNLLNAFLLPLDVLIKNIFLLDLTLLNPTISIEPNASLWFIPLIISFYLAFPWLYNIISKQKTIKGLLFIFLGMIIFEFIYRGIAIYWLDGLPVGFGHYAKLFPVWGVPFDKLPESFRFQEEYAFKFFPSRLGEFAIGMMAAVGLMRNPSIFNKVVLNPWIGTLGLCIWLAGNALICQGFWGWIFADFVIAFGMILWFINLAALLHKKLPVIFSGINELGIWSFYIFLTHYLLIFISQKLDGIVIPFVQDSAVGVKVIRVSFFLSLILGTWLATQILIKFDQSRLADLMFQRTLGRILK